MSKNNKTCCECRYMLHKDTFEVCTHSMTETSMFGVACKHFTPPTNGDKIRAMSNEEIAAVMCGLLNSRDEVVFEAILNYLNSPAESEGEDE
jgi:hypothetical protein